MRNTLGAVALSSAAILGCNTTAAQELQSPAQTACISQIQKVRFLIDSLQDAPGRFCNGENLAAVVNSARTMQQLCIANPDSAITSDLRSQSSETAAQVLTVCR